METILQENGSTDELRSERSQDAEIIFGCDELLQEAHQKLFQYSSTVLTDLTKKEAVWHWGSVEAEAFAELKRKFTDSSALGVPKPEGEIILITDSSLIGGGASIYQWQSVSSDVMVEYHKFSTEGVFADGKMKHDYPETFRLVPLGF